MPQHDWLPQPSVTVRCDLLPARFHPKLCRLTRRRRLRRWLPQCGLMLDCWFYNDNNNVLLLMLLLTTSWRRLLCSLRSETCRETNGKTPVWNHLRLVCSHFIFFFFLFFRLMEQQLQAWRLTVQSEQSILEDRCSEMEVTMETLREHNLRLQSTLTQVNTHN